MLTSDVVYTAIFFTALVALLVLAFLALRAQKPRLPAVTGYITWVYANGEKLMSKIIHLGNAPVTARVSYVNKEGDAATVVGAPAWSVEPDGIVTLAPADDGLSCVVTQVALGDATLSVHAEGDEKAGVDPIDLTTTITVAGEEATGGSITFDE